MAGSRFDKMCFILADHDERKTRKKTLGDVALDFKKFLLKRNTR